MVKVMVCAEAQSTSVGAAPPAVVGHGLEANLPQRSPTLRELISDLNPLPWEPPQDYICVSSAVDHWYLFSTRNPNYGRNAKAKEHHAMDPLAALSLAGNVVQFTQYAFQLVNGAVAIYQSASGASAQNQHLEGIHVKLSDFSENMQMWLQSRHAAPAGPASKYASGLMELTRSCKDDCDQLLGILSRLRVRQGTKGRFWQSFQKAMLEVWKSDDISRLKERIRDAQRAMTLQLCAISRSVFSPSLSSSLSTNSRRRIDDSHRKEKSENVEISSAQLRDLEIERKSTHEERERQSEVLLSSLAEIRSAVDVIKTRVGYVDPTLHTTSKGDILTGGDRMISGNDEEEFEHFRRSTIQTSGIRSGHSKSDDATPHKDFGSEDVDILTRKVSSLSLTERRFAREEAILSSLDFHKRRVRHDYIPAAHEETFEWIFEGSSSTGNAANDRFAKWLSSGGNGVFWITGKPGSGKSTLMKLIADRLNRVGGPLAAWAEPKRLVVASHYFWSAGTPIQRSQEGLLRTLLFDMLVQAPELLPKLCEKRWAEAMEPRAAQRPWTLAELSGLLRALVSLDSLPVKFCVLVDGLDEFDGEKDAICRDMLDLAMSADIKLCASSRPWNVFEDHLGPEASHRIAIHDLTRADIEKYAEDRLQQHPRWNLAVSFGGDTAKRLVDEITRRANGVFLWVYLVTKMLRDGLTNDDCITDLWKRLEDMPTDLEQFYRHILESVEPFYHKKMAGTLLMALSVDNPLPLELYSFHELEYTDERFALHQEVKPFSAEEMQTIREPIKRRLNGRCKGLLEVRGSHVEFFHRTARDFFLTGQMTRFLTERTTGSFNASLSSFRAYVAWIKCSSFYNVSNERLLRQGDVFETHRRWSDGFRNTMAMALSFSKMAIEVDESCRSCCYEHLDDLELSVETMALTGQIRGISALRSNGSTEERVHRRARSLFREMVIQCGLDCYLSAKLADDHLQYFADFDQPPLWVALQTFVSDINDYFQGHGRTRPDAPTGMPECIQVMKCLLEHGYDPNESCVSRSDIYDSWPTEAPDPEATPWTEAISQLLLSPDNKTEDNTIRLTPGSEDAIAHFLNSGFVSVLVSFGADCNSMVKIRQQNPDPDNGAVPEKISACALFLLLPFFAGGIWKSPGSYFKDLRAMVSKADYALLRTDLFGPDPRVPGLLWQTLNNIQTLAGGSLLSRHIKSQQFCAQALCELARFDSHGLPWEELSTVLPTVFQKNILDKIDDSIAKRGCENTRGSQLSQSDSQSRKRGLDCSEMADTPMKRMR